MQSAARLLQVLRAHHQLLGGAGRPEVLHRGCALPRCGCPAQRCLLPLQCGRSRAHQMPPAGDEGGCAVHACVRPANRVMQGMYMLLEAKRWAQRTHPWCAFLHVQKGNREWGKKGTFATPTIFTSHACFSGVASAHTPCDSSQRSCLESWCEWHAHACPDQGSRACDAGL